MKKVKFFYNEKMCPNQSVSGISKSPLKPQLYREFLKTTDIYENLEEENDFLPYTIEDFYLAHEKGYVNRFFTSGDSSNGLAWSADLAESVKYTNSSLYHAIRYSIQNPGHVGYSPTSGFHHAHPWGGGGFCTFSGQVIASLKLYRGYGLSGAYFDLDGHFGNSIEDSRRFHSDVNLAIPPGCNYNPVGKDQDYLVSLQRCLEDFKNKFMEKKLHYLVFCHGADSHEWDDLGGTCNTECWFECSKMLYSFIDSMEKKEGVKIPLAISLFGGYRSDDYDSVLNLHAGDLAICLDTVLGIDTNFQPEIKPKGI